jgi:MHS family alpha-ketoglutarate permease-like MFS transporter
LAVVVFFIRRRLSESPGFEAAQRSGKVSSGASLFRDHPREALLVMALTAGGTLAFYAYTTYMQKYLANTVGFDRPTASRIMTAALFVFMLLQPVAGAISDRVGRKPVMIAFGVAGTVLTVPLFMALEDVQSPWAAFALVMVSLVLVTGYTSINAVVKAELFPSHIRALGVALPYAIANTIFGGTAEYVALWLKGAGHERLFYFYVAGMIGLSLIAYTRMRETRTTSRIDMDSD